MAHVRPNLPEIVAEMPKVQAAVKAQAEALEARMKALVAPHSKSGNLFRSIKVERAFKRKDWWVTISASYAVPVNYGFLHNFTHKRVHGINFIKNAIHGG